MPARQKAAECHLLGGLDLLAERCERGATEASQHVGVAPLPFRPARPQLAADEPLLALERLQLGLDAVGSEPEALRRLARRERPAAAGEAREQGPQRVVAGLEEDVGQAARRHGAHRVAVAARILGGSERLVPADADPDRTPLAQQALGEAGVVLALEPVAAQEQHVVETVRIARRAMQLRLDLLDRPGVEQVAQLLLAEQLAQQVAVERQRLRAALRGRRVVLVHVRGDVVEEQRGARTARRTRVSISTRSSCRGCARPASSRSSAGRSNTSCRHSR